MSRGSGLLLVCSMAAAGAAAFATADGRYSAGGIATRIPLRLPVVESAVSGPLASPLSSFEEPLNLQVIDAAISNAVDFHYARDRAGAGEYSRQCQRKLREDPNLAWFDTCSAFDEATITLRDDELGVDGGHFDPSAVVTREFAAAKRISGDVLGADYRLHQIRLQVELRLLPILDPAAGAAL